MRRDRCGLPWTSVALQSPPPGASRTRMALGGCGLELPLNGRLGWSADGCSLNRASRMARDADASSMWPPPWLPWLERRRLSRPDGPVQWMIVGARCGREGLLPQPLLAARFAAGNKEAVFVMCRRAHRRARGPRAQTR